MMYVVDTFDGISGESKDFSDLSSAKKYFENQRKYYSENNYKYESIELFSYNEETEEKIETIEIC